MDKQNEQQNNCNDEQGDNNSSSRTKVCELAELKLRKKKAAVVNGRRVILFLHEDVVYALDEKCYHAGGPLSKGEIEEVGQYSCVVCPWHKRKICLATGNDILECSDGEVVVEEHKQRPHAVEVVNGEVFVSVDVMPPGEWSQGRPTQRVEYESDKQKGNMVQPAAAEGTN